MDSHLDSKTYGHDPTCQNQLSDNPKAFTPNRLSILCSCPAVHTILPNANRIIEIQERLTTYNSRNFFFKNIWVPSFLLLLLYYTGFPLSNLKTNQTKILWQNEIQYSATSVFIVVRESIFKNEMQNHQYVINIMPVQRWPERQYIRSLP